MSPTLYRLYDKALLWLMLIFFAAHMANHVIIIAGADAHIAMMDTLRVVYRFPLIELLLVWAIFRQIVAGIRQMRRFGPIKSKGRFRVLVWSGIYLIAFMIIHMGAVAINRYALGVDTNLYFATAGYRSALAAWFFYPYYFIAITAAFAHLGAVIWLRKRATAPAFANAMYLGAFGFGLVLATYLMLTLSGILVPFDIPAPYMAMYP